MPQPIIVKQLRVVPELYNYDIDTLPATASPSPPMLHYQLTFNNVSRHPTTRLPKQSRKTFDAIRAYSIFTTIVRRRINSSEGGPESGVSLSDLMLGPLMVNKGFGIKMMFSHRKSHSKLSRMFRMSRMSSE